MDTTDAQLPQAGADSQNNGNAVGQPVNAGNGVPDGVQRRFDEMTAEKHALKAQVDALVAQNAQQMEMLQQAITRTQQAQLPQVPQVDIDPEQKKVMDAYLAPFLAQIKHQVDQTVGQLRPTVQQTALQQALQGESDPRVQQLAQKLLREWSSKPQEYGTRWNEQDAVTYARGQVAHMDRQNGGAPQAARQAMNANAQPVQGFSNAGVNVPPPPAGTSGEAPPLPANFDELPYGKQAQILEERIRKYGDGRIW